MLKILYEDQEILVVEKPAGMESQASRKLEPDMVSEIKKYRSRYETGQLSTKKSTNLSPGPVDSYVGVIHRLDKPVSGVMVYAKTKKAAASLSQQVQDGRMKKVYHAVVCGKPVDNVGNYVDFLLREGKTNFSTVVEKGTKDAKRAELRYRVLKTLPVEYGAGESVMEEACRRSLVEIELLTGRNHQIRVQFAAHGTPLWGDARYNPLWGGTLPVPERKSVKMKMSGGTPEQMSGEEKAADRGSFSRNGNGRVGSRRENLALAAVRLSLIHPVSGKRMEFSMKPKNAVFRDFE